MQVATLGGGAETQTLNSYRPQPPQHSLHTEATYPPFSELGSNCRSVSDNVSQPKSIVFTELIEQPIYTLCLLFYQLKTVNLAPLCTQIGNRLRPQSITMADKMQGRASSARVFRSRIPTLLVSMFATFASIYVAGRLWQDSENRVYLIKELDRIIGQGRSVISVDDTLKIIACREQHKKLSALEMELAAARQEGFTLMRSTEINGTDYKRRPLVVIGIFTTFGRKNNRDAIRKAWMGTGAALKKMENEKGIIARFVIGRSANHGDSLDRAIDNENRQTKDFIILDTHVEAPEEFPKKAKLFFAHAAEEWNAEFYSKVNDDVYVNIDALGATLATHLDKPRAKNGMNQNGGSLAIKNRKCHYNLFQHTTYFKLPDIFLFKLKTKFLHPTDISATLQVRCTSYLKLWPNLSQSIELYSVPMRMMISVSGLGLLGLMLNMWMKPNFAALLGREVVCENINQRQREGLKDIFASLSDVSSLHDVEEIGGKILAQIDS
ncbi:Galactosyltransferase family protein [Prunus dulcis]|uniref:Hexosyltransferase n=1 Tax=Prunus dulcis TaxID=3755 RepID=A0A4Y1R2K7_PRUDU|nr:Galactosyltransferase family protein [Prunus dulcis]